MPVTDDQVATLRAQLAGDHDEHRRLLADLNRQGALSGYMALVTAAFIEAVDRRLGPEHRDDAAVIELIGDVRSHYPGADDKIDPATAERVVRKALGHGSLSDLDGPTIRRTESLLLPLIMASEPLTPEELDQFLADARKLLDGRSPR